jgi:hypothetical protein
VIKKIIQSVLTFFSSLKFQLQEAYQEKDDECRRLKRYIDTILLNIVENYPQLLEIKSGENENLTTSTC